MISWVDFGIVQCYQNRAALPYLDKSRRHSQSLTDPGEIRKGKAGATTSVIMQIENTALVAPLLTEPPRTATLHTVDDHGRQSSFTGDLRNVRFDAASVSVEVQVLGLSDRLPLRTSDEWGTFESVQVIPRMYGRGPSTPVLYDENGTTWVWLAGVNGGVESVTVDGVPVAFSWHNGVDSAGKAVTFVELAQAPTSGEIVATGSGLLGSDGSLISNPADIIADLLGLYGRTADLVDFRAEAARRGVVCEGVFDSEITGREAITQICDSIGARWSSTSPGFAAFYPVTVPSSVPKTVDTIDADHRWNSDALVSSVRVLYDYDQDGPRRVLQYRAPWWESQIGERVKEIEARFLRSTALADRLAQNELNRHGRHVWLIEKETSQDVNEFEWVQTENGTIAVDDGFVVDVQRNQVDGSRKLTIEVVTGADPVIELLPLATAFEPVSEQPQFRRDTNTFALFVEDDNGGPLAGAKVTHVKSGATTTSDGAGWATFASHLIPPGSTQTFLIQADGYTDNTVGMTV